MKYPQRSDRSGGWNGPKKFGSAPRHSGGRSSFQSGPRPMFQADCDDCGSRCEVPFKPFANKPVFCNNCFKKDEAPAEGKGFNKFDKRPSFRSDRTDRSERPRFDEQRGFEANCDKCGKRCDLPFKPNGKKPVYCRDCFSGSAQDYSKKDFSGAGKGGNMNNGLEQLAEQLKAMNIKLDNILRVVHNKPEGPEDTI